MSVREVQTAAARVLHVDRLSDTAINELKTRFRYHPLDIEALFSLPVEPSFSTYSDYAFVTLLWPNAGTQDMSELRLFVDKQQLTIIGDTSDAIIQHFVEQLHNQLGSSESQLTAPELVHEVMQRLRQPWQEQTGGINALSGQRMVANAQVLRQFGRWLQTSNLSTVVPQLIVDAHSLDSLAERPHAAVVVTQPKASIALPSLLRTYAVTSAVMVIIVIVTLSVY